MTDAGGYPVESYTYDVYGKPYVMISAGEDDNWLTEDAPTQNYSSIGNPYLFTGRRWYSGMGLYYYRFRDYAPELGRFLQTDLAGYVDGMNLYAYCANNPLNWIDPWGLATLGIHGDEDHSWISYTDNNGNTTTYGLWAQDWARPYMDGTDGIGRLRPNDSIYVNCESSREPGYASRYYELTENQEARFRNFLAQDNDYFWPFNTCVSFAEDAAQYIVDEDIDADSWFHFETPTEFMESIEELEKENPTDHLTPDSLKDS